MSWWPFGKETATATLDGPHALLADIERRGKQYLDDIDTGKFITPACKRTASDAACDQAAIAAAWQKIRGRVRDWTDLEPALIGRVEELIDFVTA